MIHKPIDREERILRYHEDEHFCVSFRAHLDYDRSDMWTTVRVNNLHNGESKTYIFNANELSRAQSCYADQLRLLF